MLFEDFQLILFEHDLKDGYHYYDWKLMLCQIFIVSMRLFTLIFACALITNIYKQAMVYERGHYVPNENKEEFYEQISEIQHHINFLYKKKNKTSHESDVEVGNQKIVAWLLNRSKEAQSSERSEFFKKLNKEI